MQVDVGDKFIIEVGEVFYADCADDCDSTALYRIKNFNALVFDEQGLDKLKRFRPQPDRFDEGAEYAQSIYKKLLELSSSDLKDMFPEVKGGTIASLIGKFTAAEIEERMKSYTPSFKVGEVLQVTDAYESNSTATQEGLVIYVEHEQPAVYHIMLPNGYTLQISESDIASKVKRTGQTFDSISEFVGVKNAKRRAED